MVYGQVAPDDKKRIALHIDMDAFFVSVEETLNPKLKGKPVVVGGDPSGRGVVSSASYKAREYGVRSAMPLATAKKICPEVIFLRGSPHVYAEYSRRIMDILARYTPVVEPVSVDEAYLDLTGLKRLHKADSVTIAQRMHDAIQDEVGVPSSIGIATNKVTAKIAANVAKPNGMLFIRPGCEASFLGPMPIGKMPGVGPVAEKEYRKMGIVVIGDLLRFTPKTLEQVLGKHASVMAARAKGIDDRKVASADRDVKSISKEVTYAVDTEDLQTLESTLSYLSEKVCDKARRTGLAFRRVTLKLRYADFTTYTRARTINTQSDDARALFRVARKLLRDTFTRRLKVRLIGVGVSSFSAPLRQIELFEDSVREARERLNIKVDETRNRFGFESAMMARSLLYAEAKRNRHHDAIY
ncbi:DNA polymerase IV [hydrothermal vent metagenome]|uniref:DNA-directed DNA polymerase n=1 Tax=hydrothermal vent metagenome TaxID=652676 RepID=A0A3B1CCK0_9ZZZZ